MNPLRQTRFIIGGMYIPKGIVPNDEVWIVENQILLKQTGEDELSAFVISEKANYSDENARKKIFQYLSLWPLLTYKTPTMKPSGFNDINSIEEAGTNYYITGEIFLGNRLRLSKRMLVRSKEIYQKIVDLNNKFLFLETSNNFYYNASKPIIDIQDFGKFNSRHFVDAAVSLESLFNEGQGDISYKLCIRAAFLLGFLGQNRKEVFEDIRRLYRIRNDIVHGIAEENPAHSDTNILLEYAKKSLQCCYILSYNRREKSRNHFKRNLLAEIDEALLSHNKCSQINDEIDLGIKDFSLDTL